LLSLGDMMNIILPLPSSDSHSPAFTIWHTSLSSKILSCLATYPFDWLHANLIDFKLMMISLETSWPTFFTCWFTAGIDSLFVRAGHTVQKWRMRWTM
jgi:hypothetical protein